VAEVLADHGVEVRHETRVADAVAAAGPGTTLLVTPSPLLLPEQAEAIAASAADVVVLEADGYTAEVVSDGAVTRVPAGGTPGAPVAPRCDLPAAVAAGDLLLAEGGLEAMPGHGDDVTLCWPGEAGATLAHLTRDDGA